MPNPVPLDTVATSLRTINVILQALEAPDFTSTQSETLSDVRAIATSVIASLDALSAGTPQTPLSGKILPIPGVMDGAQNSIAKDRAALDPLLAFDFGAQSTQFHKLITQVENLSDGVASAARR